MEQIKQQIARENINFVRFEATDLHGVSRSKTVPVRFFHVNLSTFTIKLTTNLHSYPTRTAKILRGFRYSENSSLQLYKVL